MPYNLTNNGTRGYYDPSPPIPGDESAESIRVIEQLVDSEIAEIKAKTDKIGLETDTVAAKTLLGYQNSLYQHVHQQSKCYPTLANGIVVTGAAGAWTLGAFVELIPANAITTMFDIHYINFEESSVADSFEFVLYSGLGGSEVEIGRVRTSRESAVSGITNVPVQIPAQNANTRISAKVASKSGGSDTVTVSVYYHIYT